MEKVGETLKILRISKNLTQKQISNEIMDLSYYGRIEKDQLNITFTKLMKLLSKLDITIEEFMFIKREIENQNQDSIQNRIVKAYYEENINNLMELRKESANKFKSTNYLSYRHSYILCQYLLSRFNKQVFDSKYVDEIIEYLNSLSYYTKSDVKMLVDFYQVLPSEMVFYLFETFFITKRHSTALWTSGEQTVLLFYFNTIHLALKKQKYQFAKKVLEKAKQEFTNPLNLLVVNLISYYDGIFLLLAGKIENGTLLAENAIKVLKLSNLEFQAIHHEEYLEEIKKMINTPSG